MCFFGDFKYQHRLPEITYPTFKHMHQTFSICRSILTTKKSQKSNRKTRNVTERGQFGRIVEAEASNFIKALMLIILGDVTRFKICIIQSFKGF